MRSVAANARAGRGGHRRAAVLLRATALLGFAAAGACITDPDLKVRRDARPIDAGDGWAVSSPAAEAVDSAAVLQALDLFYSEDAYHNVISLLVVRHGKLIVEAFARDPGERLVRRNTQSATKSVTSLVFGIARDQGYFPDLQQTLYEIMPEKFDEDVNKRAITLDHLMTMRSGIAFDNDDFAIEMAIRRPRDQVRYILAKPTYALPGDSFYYRDADPQLLSSAVERVTGRTLEAIARQSLFAPLGITDYYWEANVEGTSFGAFGLFLRARDLAKLGQLMLRRGYWDACSGGQGCQVVSGEWIDTATTAHTASNHPELPYGYYWWVVPELSGFMALGHGGNCVLVLPQKDLVVVLTALPDAGDEAGTSSDEFLALARLLSAGTH